MSAPQTPEAELEALTALAAWHVLGLIRVANARVQAAGGCCLLHGGWRYDRANPDGGVLGGFSLASCDAFLAELGLPRMRDLPTEARIAELLPYFTPGSARAT